MKELLKEFIYGVFIIIFIVAITFVLFLGLMEVVQFIFNFVLTIKVKFGLFVAIAIIGGSLGKKELK